MSGWEAEIWQTENGKWRWSVFSAGNLIATCKKSCSSRRQAVAEAREAKASVSGPTYERISLDDDE